MDDCIYRQAAMNALCDNCDTVQAVCPHFPCKRYTSVEALPSEDVQPVVRCKNCCYWDESDIHSTIHPNRRCRAVVGKIYTDSEFYCAYGERKDDKR